MAENLFNLKEIWTNYLDVYIIALGCYSISAGKICIWIMNTNPYTNLVPMLLSYICFVHIFGRVTKLKKWPLSRSATGLELFHNYQQWHPSTLDDIMNFLKGFNPLQRTLEVTLYCFESSFRIHTLLTQSVNWSLSKLIKSVSSLIDANWR